MARTKEVEAIVKAQTLANELRRDAYVVVRSGEWMAVDIPLQDDDVQWEVKPSSTS